MNSADLMVAINMSVFFGMVAFVVWIVMSSWQRRQQLKNMTEFNTRLVDRIGSIKDFGEFLQTEGGAKFMGTMTVGRDSIGSRDRILRATQIGIILVVLGVGLLLVSEHAIFKAIDQDVSLTARDNFWIAGIIVLALGVGFLISSVASYYLGKNLSDLDTTRPRSQ
jgi:hypothetical protein